MKHILVVNYIDSLSNKVDIQLKALHVETYKLVLTNNNEPVFFFDIDAVVFKLYKDGLYYALKCYTNSFKQEQDSFHEYVQLDIKALQAKNIDNNLMHECQLEVVDSLGNIQNVSVLLTPWIQNITYLEDNSFYIKEFHNSDNNYEYKKLRRKIKTRVFGVLTVLITLIYSLKLMYPDQVYINAIDYKEIIEEDFNKSISLNKEKTTTAKELSTQYENVLGKNNTKEVVIAEKNNEDKIKAEPAIVLKSSVSNKSKKTSKAVASLAVTKEKATNKNEKAKLNAIKVISSKSVVTFRSTEF